MNKLARDLATVDNLSTGLVAPTRKNELMNTQPTITLELADSVHGVPETTSHGRAGEGMSVMTKQAGQFFTRFTTTKATLLSNDDVALTVWHDMEESDTGESVKDFPTIWANVFVSREHARKFALAILNELDN